MSPPRQMTITLTDELEQFVRNEVKEGAFASDSDYIGELVEQRYRRKQERDEKLRTLNAALERGMADSAAERVTELSEAFERIHAAVGLSDDRSGGA